MPTRARLTILSFEGQDAMSDTAFLDRLRDLAGVDAVSTRFQDRARHAGDQWARSRLVRATSAPPSGLPDVVVRPADVATLAAVMGACRDAEVPVVPFGGGTGICGGTVAVEGGVSLDLSRLDRVIHVDDLSMSVLVEAGTPGAVLEDALSARGYTLGHCPMWPGAGTVGGWAATRAAGWFSARYGAFEDMVVALDVVLPDGTLVTIDSTTREFGGPDFRQFFLGSEGMLGVIARLRLRVRPAPQTRRFWAFRFMEMDMGLEAMRRVMQHGLVPSALRLMDPFDTLVSYFGSGGSATSLEVARTLEMLRRLLHLDLGGLAESMLWPVLRQMLAHPLAARTVLDQMPLASLLFVGFEGDEDRTRDDLAEARDLIARATGLDLGPEPGEHWYRRRLHPLPYDAPVFGAGGFVETVAVTGLWRDLSRIHEKARAAAGHRVLMPAFFTNAYREGAVCHFRLLGMAGTPDRSLDLYDWAVPRVIGAAMKAGATVAHGSGIGLAKRDFTDQEFRGGSRLFWALRQALDPGFRMNPQKLYPTTVPAVPQGEDDMPATGVRPDALLAWDHRVADGAIVTPEVPEEISELLRIARRSGRRVFSQAGDLAIVRRRPRDSASGDLAIRLDLLDRIIDMDPVSGTVTVQTGMSMVHLENFLREKGFTLGFVPRRLLSLSVGDYLASASPWAGSPLYGTVHDNCIGLSAILGDGTSFAARAAPRRSAGPDLMHCFIGARGRYGIVTAACFRVFPWPAVREAVAFGTQDPEIAVSAIRTVLARDVLPEWVLMVLRSPSSKGNRRRVRVVLQMGGSRRHVSRGLAVIRDVMEPLGMDPEPIRTEDRLLPPPKRFPSHECFLPMDRVMALARRFGAEQSPECPEVHVTHFGSHGATVRVLLREDIHRVPDDLVALFQGGGHQGPLAEASDVLKQQLDPDDVLAPPATLD